jgi:hypothetical protein
MADRTRAHLCSIRSADLSRGIHSRPLVEHMTTTVTSSAFMQTRYEQFALMVCPRIVYTDLNGLFCNTDLISTSPLTYSHIIGARCRV